jgi:hypothetical protein
MTGVFLCTFVWKLSQMKIKGVLLLMFLCLPLRFLAQEDAERDTFYLEDQLFLSIVYNSLMDTPPAFEQNGISYGLSFGFIKDIPFNKRRNLGMALGLGYAYHRYNHNLLHDTGGFRLAEAYASNVFSHSSLEVPLEFRWRTSTYDKFKFWRIYGGINFSYLFRNRAKYRLGQETTVLRNMTEINKFQYGISLAAGYNTWNFYVNYALTPLYKDGVVDTNDALLRMKPLRLGLIFYML